MDLDKIREISLKLYLIQLKGVKALARMQEIKKSAEPTMLLITNAVKKPTRAEPTMYMKTKVLWSKTHDVYENKYT
jgi:hypothetical protein